jgi:hypothetical protein
MSTPKIFVVCDRVGNEFRGYALAEDGTGLAAHISSSRHWCSIDMGCDLNVKSPKFDIYSEHYPQGFELIDLTMLGEEELLYADEYQAALILNQAQAHAPPE